MNFENASAIASTFLITFAQYSFINDILANLLVQRGISNYDEAKSYFRPELSDLHDPFHIARKAVKEYGEDEPCF